MIQAIGVLRVAVPGTPVRATSGQANPAENLRCHGVLFQALPTNTGVVYVGDQALTPGAFTGVFGMLAIPTTNLLPSFSAAVTISTNSLSLEDFYLDAAVANDGAICTILVA